jgi:uncharacterized protein (TIGR02246 family)
VQDDCRVEGSRDLKEAMAMPSPTSELSSAHAPEDLHRIVEDAMNRGDLEAFLDAHDEHATVVVPPDGRSAHGRDDIRAAIAPLMALRPKMTTVMVKKLETDDLALTHGRWSLAVTERGQRSELSGIGTMVSRRGSDGTWRIVLDDPLFGV